MDDSRQSVPSTQGEIGLDDVAYVVRSSWRFCLAGAAVLGGLSAGVLWTQPRQWEATASLQVSPPAFSSALKPVALTVQSYQRLLESPALLSAAKDKLVTAGAMKADEILVVGRQIETRIFTNKRGDDTASAPFIECRARDQVPEKAALIANTWAQIFLDNLQIQMREATAPTFSLIENQYQNSNAQLLKQENARLKAATEIRLRYTETQTRWNNLLATQRNETAVALAKYQNESDQLLSERRNSKDLSLRRVQANAQAKALADMRGVQVQIESAQRGSESKPTTAESPATGSERNPVGERITLSPSLSVGIYGDKKSREFLDQLKTQEQRLAENLASLQTQLAVDDLAILQLQRERDSGLETLKEKRANDLANRINSQQLELGNLALEEKSTLEQFDREILRLKGLVGSLGINFDQAQIAKAQQNCSDIRLSSLATTPEEPLPRGAQGKVAVAAFLGSLLGLLLAQWRNIGRRFGAKPA